MPLCVSTSDATTWRAYALPFNPLPFKNLLQKRWTCANSVYGMPECNPRSTRLHICGLYSHTRMLWASGHILLLWIMCLHKLPTAKLIIFAVLQSLLIFPTAHEEDLEAHKLTQVRTNIECKWEHSGGSGYFGVVAKQAEHHSRQLCTSFLLLYYICTTYFVCCCCCCAFDLCKWQWRHHATSVILFCGRWAHKVNSEG